MGKRPHLASRKTRADYTLSHFFHSTANFAYVWSEEQSIIIILIIAMLTLILVIIIKIISIISMRATIEANIGGADLIT